MKHFFLNKKNVTCRSEDLNQKYKIFSRFSTMGGSKNHVGFRLADYSKVRHLMFIKNAKHNIH